MKKNRIPRPFLKWVGGKSQLLPTIRELYPKKFNVYHEPFVGGGAVFFDLLPEKAILSDANGELINCYKMIQTWVGTVIKTLHGYVYDKDQYYSVRAQNTCDMGPLVRAARTIYLNKTGFNGLYRVNQKGKFNVPFGRYTNPTICDEANLLGCSKALHRVMLHVDSFEKILYWARSGDFVYFDPPYIPISGTSNFTAYQRNGFGMESQDRLACVFEELDIAGVKVLLSNSAVPWIFDRYSGFEIRTVDARRSINSDASKRGSVKEVLIKNY